jgi:fructosamine-3-kinase
VPGPCPLTEPPTVADIEAAVSRHLRRPWQVESVTDVGDRSSHPAVVFHGPGLSVFAKQAEAPQQLVDELAGLALLRDSAEVSIPAPIGQGWLPLPDGTAVMLTEGLSERVPAQRTPSDWTAIGHTLARIHQVRGKEFGLGRDGWFGPLRQPNQPVPTNSWSDFYAARRIIPWLASSRDSGSVTPAVAKRVERLVDRLPELVGPEPEPRLLHGDAQHHNFISTAAGAVVIDASPYYGHPEVDLALLDYFAPVPPETWAAYDEISPISEGFAERRELWRCFAYLAVLTVDGQSGWGRRFVGRLVAALDRYG